MKKPVILITPERKQNELFSSMYTYHTASPNLNYFSDNGALPVIPPFFSPEMAEEIMERADGLFVTGGADVEPSAYGEEKKPWCGGTEPDRDESDIALIKAAVKLKKPILCVCRGSQITNVALGGTLHQDLKTETGTDIVHVDLADGHFLTEDSHTINVIDGTPLAELFGEKSFGVNTTHHQGVKDLAPGAVLQATAPDGIVESWYYEQEGAWVRAYQWHPELQTPNKHSVGIVKNFIDECVKRMK